LKSWSRSQQCAREGKRRKEDERLNEAITRRREEGSAVSVNSKRNQSTGRGDSTPKKEREKRKISSKKVSKLQVQVVRA
jgi:sRNA-binding protein